MVLLQLDRQMCLDPIWPGKVVRDRSSGARGVVVQRDAVCSRPESWYHLREERPRREQPWFIVLFDQSSSMGYVAREDLELEPLPLPVDHPLVLVYFHAFDDSGYVRNSRGWVPESQILPASPS